MKREECQLSDGDLVLRPIGIQDLEAVFPYVSNPDIPEFMAWEAHKEIEETREFIQRLEDNFGNDKGITWSIFYKGEFAGIFSIIAILRKHRALIYNRAELAYWCGPEYQGKGIMTGAGKLVLQFAFEQMNINRLVVSHFTVNDASKNLILRLGFSYIGTEHESFQKDGIWYDHALYELLKNDFKKD